jgi:hypothetical protein
MCTLIILRRPEHPWPLLLADNRDEMLDRPWDPPARHWEDRPEVIAGRDRLAGGSWIGVNDHGLACGIMNRAGSLGPSQQKRSRGELLLEALDHAEAREAADALSHLNPASYQPFNLFLGDPRDAFWIRNAGGFIDTREVPAGLHMLTARELNDASDPRIRHFLPRFRAAPPPDPDQEDWAAWRDLLVSGESHGHGDKTAAMCFQLDNGFATLSSSLIALPAYPGMGRELIWLFNARPRDPTGFRPVLP